MSSIWQHSETVSLDTPFEPGARHDVVVVGAGLTGLSTAVMLARDGLDVAVIDAGEPGALTSGANTGKLSLLQGDRLARIRRHHPASLVRAYVDANRAGRDWLIGFAEAADVTYSVQTDYSYAQHPVNRESLHDLQAAAHEAGLPTRMLLPAALDATPFPVAGAVALAEQITLDPRRVISALTEAFLAAGGTLHTGIRATGARVPPSPHIETASGPLYAPQIVLATGTPILDRGLYFAKTHGVRSYCIAFRLPSELPAATYISVDSPTRSIRPVSPADGPATVAQLIVGGNGHPVGRTASEREQCDDLVRWTQEYFPGAEETHRWSAQDYESHNLIPFVGVMPRSRGRIRFATGYAKWGLTNAPAAALRIAAEIRGERAADKPRWMRTIGRRLTVPADLARGVQQNAAVAAAAARGWTGAARQGLPAVPPPEGCGLVAHDGARPVGVSTVDGVTRAVSAICPHLGGVLDWNDAERTWDCPLHASRFAADGTRIEGPALRDLTAHRQAEAGTAERGS